MILKNFHKGLSGVLDEIKLTPTQKKKVKKAAGKLFKEALKIYVESQIEKRK